MDRRSFLTGMLGLAAASAAATSFWPGTADAGVPNARNGILDELDATAEFEAAEAQPVDHRHGHWRGEPWGGRHGGWDNGRRRGWRRHGGHWRWRRVCRHYWHRGRRRYRCYRRRVWVRGW